MKAKRKEAAACHKDPESTQNLRDKCALNALVVLWLTAMKFHKIPLTNLDDVTGALVTLHFRIGTLQVRQVFRYAFTFSIRTQKVPSNDLMRFKRVPNCSNTTHFLPEINGKHAFDIKVIFYI